MPVPFSSSRRVVFDRFIVDVNVSCGYFGKDPKWSFLINRRTGRGSPGQEVLEGVDSIHFDGLPNTTHYKAIKAKMRRLELYDADYAFVSLAIGQLVPSAREYIAAKEQERNNKS